ncbi:MAG: hypothetical protein DMF56_11695 [Acidobacteria bacterium]|nr:MAG: hypothetical protein DMF56_11695 [Acidobacteriota bacterium]
MAVNEVRLLDGALIKYERPAKNLYERVEALVEGDKAASRIIVSIIVGGTTAFTGVASVAGLATAIAEREFFLLATATIGTLVATVWRAATRGPTGELGAAVRRIKERTMGAYRDAIANAGLISKERKSL